MRVNISSVGTSLERLLAFVVARQARHIRRVTDMNDDVRLEIIDEMPKPLSPLVVVLVVGVGIGDDEMRGQGTNP